MVDYGHIIIEHEFYRILNLLRQGQNKVCYGCDFVLTVCPQPRCEFQICWYFDMLIMFCYYSFPSMLNHRPHLNSSTPTLSGGPHRWWPLSGHQYHLGILRSQFITYWKWHFLLPPTLRLLVKSVFVDSQIYKYIYLNELNRFHGQIKLREINKSLDLYPNLGCK